MLLHANSSIFFKKKNWSVSLSLTKMYLSVRVVVKNVSDTQQIFVYLFLIHYIVRNVSKRKRKSWNIDKEDSSQMFNRCTLYGSADGLYAILISFGWFSSICSVSFAFKVNRIGRLQKNMTFTFKSLIVAV